MHYKKSCQHLIEGLRPHSPNIYHIMYLPCKAMQPGIGLIGAKSTPIMRLDMGMCSLATCIHDPGAAHKSMHTRDFWRNSNFRFNWISLNEARDLKFKIRYISDCRYQTLGVKTSGQKNRYSRSHCRLPVPNFLGRPICLITTRLPNLCLLSHC